MTRRWLKTFRLRRNSPASDVDTELRFHFERRIADLVAQGATREAAAIQAEAEFGDRQSTRAQLVEINERIAGQHQRADWWDALTQDVGYTLRGLRRTPGFTAMVVATLALGLGANTALISVLERLLWRPPAGAHEPNDVRRFHMHSFDRRTGEPVIRAVFNYPQMREVARATQPNVVVAGFRDQKVRLGNGIDSPRGAAVELIGDYFGVLGLQPSAGRFFTDDEARAETFNTVAVISHRLWIKRFGGSSAAVGQPLDLGSHRYVIIGVAPPGFHGLGLDATDVWVPMSTGGRWVGRNPTWYESRNTLSIRLVTRVRTDGDAQTLEATATRAIRSVEKRDSATTVKLASVIESVTPGSSRKELTMATRLAGVAAILLLIGCANVANLLLARGLSRRREIAVRLALGVSKSRLVAMLFTESMALALMGGVAAFVVGAVGANMLRRALLPNVTWGDRLFEMKFALLSIALAIITGVLAGLVPALRASRPGLTGALRAGARDGGGQRSRLRNGLIIAQAALSVVLVAAAGMFVVSLQRVQNIDVGYALNDIIFASPTFGEGPAPANQVRVRVPAAADRIRALPGVAAVGLSEHATFWGISWESLFLQNRDSLPRLKADGPFISYVSKEFFDAAGMRLVRGRGFTDADGGGAPLVMIMNETMARAVWPAENAIGKCLIVGEDTDPCREVIGVVSNGNAHGYIEDPAAQYYLPLDQAPANRMAYNVVVRTQPGRAKAVFPAVRAAMAETFVGWAPPDVRTMTGILDPQLQPRRLAASVYSAAALLALLIATVGIYSSVAYAVGQRMHEMGVRAALGARSSHIVGLILGEGVRVVSVGIVVGVGLALALGKAIASLLYNTSTRDPLLLASVSLALLTVALVACFVPAWRATRANPVEVLRAD